MKLAKFILPCLVVLMSGSAVRACDNNLALAYLFGYGGPTYGHRYTNDYRVPYFSMHPPVYYGERYYRPYGASPFAAWPQLQANPAYMPQTGNGIFHSGVVIDNPHYTSPEGMEFQPVSSPKVVLNSVEPKEIDNPYFTEGATEKQVNRYTSAEIH